MILLDGKATSQIIKDSIKNELDSFISNGLRKPHLVAILVGEDGASRTYVDSKERNSIALGFNSTVLRLPDSTSQEELIKIIKSYNVNPEIDGLLVQSPLPKHINESLITQTIAPEKDVDGFHDINMGKLAKGDEGFVSATPLGVMMMLEAYGIETKGKHCVVVGRSNIVGRPMSLLMSSNRKFGNSTVTICHSQTINIESYTLQADILIAALGKPGFITADMVKPGAVVIDVGITRIEDSSRKSGFYLKGDVDFQSVSEKASYITPVPGGVGLMTIAALLSNTFKAYKNNLNLW
ncbi:MAG: bifunctional 5,10-methylenetetrahydrofolate dehydrogenase/5,10-methenyltetrahydrofolate cyclohydrolase [Bacteroidia bacterium]|nr:bifunctional 5,10-methylenetetrahydrofolate dehydrogenase/5,10-methenyltetrahydrofolate cyclohydrolase [Bacteroidia bacterium]